MQVGAGDLVLFSALNVHTNEKYWKNALDYRPERWIDEENEETKNFFAFGDGPRRCPGEFLAILEGTVVVSELLRRFKFEIANANVVETKLSLTLTVNTLPLKITKLQ